jgi:hypothetical protein
MSFEIKPTLKTPHVIIDSAAANISISGISIPEDPHSFYASFLKELDEFLKSHPKKLTFEFKLEYFNTSSALMIRRFLKKLAENQNKSDILVKWFYENYDEDLKTAGEEFSSLVEDLKFSLIGIDEFS